MYTYAEVRYSAGTKRKKLVSFLPLHIRRLELLIPPIMQPHVLTNYRDSLIRAFHSCCV